MVEPQATFLFLKVSGAEAVKSASELLAKVVGGAALQVDAAPTEVPAAIVSDPTDKPAAIENQPQPTKARPAKRLGRPRKAKVDKYKKSDDEPDGFSLPSPSPSKVVDGGGNGRPVKRSKSEMLAGTTLGNRIVQWLGINNGVAPLEIVAQKLGEPAQRISRAVGHSEELKRMPDGRVALERYEDED